MIFAAGREQSLGIEQVNQAIAQMDEITQQNAALVEQAAAAAGCMKTQSDHLHKVVNAFKLMSNHVELNRCAVARSATGFMQ